MNNKNKGQITELGYWLLEKINLHESGNQARLARGLEINRSTVHKWICGEGKISKNLLGKLKQRWNLSEQEFNKLRSLNGAEIIFEEQAKTLFPAVTQADQIIDNLPFPKNPFFTGREEVLHSLHKVLISGTTPQAISGLAGIGKTQVAMEYAYRYSQNYHSVFWLQADSREILLSGFVNLAQILNLPERNDQDQTRVFEAVKYWLKRNKKWLLILDNIEDFCLLEEFVPSNHHGSVLLTTQASVTEPFAYASKLQKMTEQEGILFLLRRVKFLALHTLIDQASKEDYILAKNIWKQMDGLPLALDQAGAYILQTQCGLTHYLDLYQQQQAKLLKMRGKALPRSHPESVFVTFSLAFEKVGQMSRIATDLLQLCTLLHPEAIPEEIFTWGAQHLGPLLQAVIDPLVYDEAISTLLTFSLISRDSSDHTLTVHRLVQAILKDMMDQQTIREWAERLVRTMHYILPLNKGLTQQPLYQRYFPQVLACATCIGQWQLAFPEAVQVLNQAGFYLVEHMRYSEAKSFLEQALAIAAQQEDSIQPEDRVDVMDTLARLYSLQKNHKEAESLYQQALVICEQQIGEHHSITAGCMNGLALTYCEQGNYEEAERLYRRALAIQREEGPLSQGLAMCLNNVALLYHHQQRYEEAEPLYRQALMISEQVMGPMHIDTAKCLNNLGHLSLTRGKYGEAESLLKRALDIYEQADLMLHPDTLKCLGNLFELYLQQGKYEEAEKRLRQVLVTSKQRLGEYHQVTLQTLDNLAMLYEKQKKYKEAEPILKYVLEIREQELDDTQEDLIGILISLVNLYLNQERYEEAEPLLKRLLVPRNQEQGSLLDANLHHHGVVLICGLASFHAEQGKYEEAKFLCQQALAFCEQELGDQHPDTGICLNKLASIHHRQERYEEAEQLYLRAHVISEHKYSSPHLDQTIELNNLIYLCFQQGKSERMMLLMKRALAIYERVLGPQHPDMRTIKKNYALLLGIDIRGDSDLIGPLFDLLIEKVSNNDEPIDTNSYDE